MIARKRIPDGRAGAVATLQHMAQLARAGSRDLAVRAKAMHLTRALRQKDYEAEACKLLHYVRDDVRYVRDIASVEVIQTPATTMSGGGGDCDDKSILLAALLGSIGHQARFVAIAYAPERFSHVWVQTNVWGRWLDLEPTEPISCGRSVPTAGAAEILFADLDGGVRSARGAGAWPAVAP